MQKQPDPNAELLSDLEQDLSGLTALQKQRVQRLHGVKKKGRQPRTATREGTSLPHTDFPTATGNFDTSRKPIRLIVLHTIVGTTESAKTVFNRVGRYASAHYIVDLDGSLHHGLEEYYTAYHAGNYNANQSSIGIEHEDNGQYNAPRTDALYTTAGKLIADICRFYNIPCRLITRADFNAGQAGIIDHRNITLTGTLCPSSLDIHRMIREANAILNNTNDPLTILKTVKPLLFFDNAWWNSLYRVKLMRGKYNESNPAQSLSDIRTALYYNNTWWNNLYRVKMMKGIIK